MKIKSLRNRKFLKKNSPEYKNTPIFVYLKSDYPFREGYRSSRPPLDYITARVGKNHPFKKIHHSMA